MEFGGEGFVGFGRSVVEGFGKDAGGEDGPDVGAGSAEAFGLHGGEDVGEQGAGPFDVEALVGGGVWCGRIRAVGERGGGAEGGGAVMRDLKALEAGKEEGSEAATGFIGAGEELLFEDFVGDEGLEEIIGLVGREAADEAEVAAEGGEVAREEGVESGAAGLGIGEAGAADERPVGGGEGMVRSGVHLAG